MTLSYPSVTYVIPTLNSGKTLDLTLYSLYSQEQIKIEIIVVDSGSEDNTLEICQRWNVKTLYTESGNIYRAINKGLIQSQSNWLGYINSDDWLYPNSVYRLILEAEKEQADFAYGRCDYTDQDGRFLFSSTPAYPHQIIPLFKLNLFGLNQQASLFRASLYHQLKGFDESYQLVSDADFVIRAIQIGAKLTLLSSNSLACFRQHSNQLSRRKLTENIQERQQIRQPLEKPKFQDYLALLNWRYRNIPDYLIRFLRPSLLSQGLTFPHLYDKFI